MMNIKYFNQLSFSLPSLFQFVCPSALTFRSAVLHFDKYFDSLIVDSLDKHTGCDNSRRTHPLLLQVKGKALN